MPLSKSCAKVLFKLHCWVVNSWFTAGFKGDLWCKNCKVHMANKPVELYRLKDNYAFMNEFVTILSRMGKSI